MRGVEHSMQVRHRVFDVVVLVLSGPAFGGDHTATMDIFEIAVGKFVMGFRVLALFVVHSQITFAVSREAVSPDEFILLERRRPMFAPRISLVEHELTLADK